MEQHDHVPELRVLLFEIRGHPLLRRRYEDPLVRPRDNNRHQHRVANGGPDRDGDRVDPDCQQCGEWVYRGMVYLVDARPQFALPIPIDSLHRHQRGDPVYLQYRLRRNKCRGEHDQQLRRLVYPDGDGRPGCRRGVLGPRRRARRHRGPGTRPLQRIEHRRLPVGQHRHRGRRGQPIRRGNDRILPRITAPSPPLGPTPAPCRLAAQPSGRWPTKPTGMQPTSA